MQRNSILIGLTCLTIFLTKNCMSQIEESTSSFTRNLSSLVEDSLYSKMFSDIFDAELNEQNSDSTNYKVIRISTAKNIIESYESFSIKVLDSCNILLTTDDSIFCPGLRNRKMNSVWKDKNQRVQEIISFLNDSDGKIYKQYSRFGCLSYEYCATRSCFIIIKGSKLVYGIFSIGRGVYFNQKDSYDHKLPSYKAKIVSDNLNYLIDSHR